jgi:uncharacterized membrane protein
MNITCSDNKKSAQSAIKTHYALIDYLRGIAIILMFIYHFFFDLNYYQFIQTDFYNNPWWIHFRTVIVSLFLWLVGISLFLSAQNGINCKRYFKRLLLLSIAAILVSLSSYVTFPNSYIFFGILHFIIVASLVGLLFTHFYRLNLILGIAIIVIGTNYSNSIFNHDALQWFGLMPNKPATEDYAPFMPWFGVVLIGMFSAHLFFVQQHFKKLSNHILSWTSPHTSQQKLICGMGRYSLLLYLLHQPVFMGILFVFRLIIGDSI